MAKKYALAILLLMLGLPAALPAAMSARTEPVPPSAAYPEAGHESIPQKEKRVRRLKKVKSVKVTRFSTSKVKLSWVKHKKARYYRVYRSRKKKAGYKLAGITKDCHMLVGGLKKNVRHYFYVQACEKKDKSESDGKPSNVVSIKMKKYRRKIIFAGDSLCEGIGYGGGLSHMKSDAIKKVVAYRGLNTITFHTKRVFNGKTGLQKLISEKPYRVYMMLGINEIHYRPADQIIREYKAMIRAIKKACPGTDIVLCAVSPVTRAEAAKHPGMKHIPAFNGMLKKLAAKLKLTYYDYTGFLKDSDGYLKNSYAEKDGYHWKMPVYAKFGEIVAKYDKSLDE